MAGKQTPRQKMIGMMYLVLTALLALNVQKEVLNAFVIVDEGLTKMNENYEVSNKDLYGTLNQAVAEKEKIGKPYQLIANEVKKRADEICGLINKDKLEIVKTSEGEKSEAISHDTIIPDKIGGKEKTDVPSEVMITKGRGKELKDKIESYREYLLSKITNPEARNVKNGIEEGLKTKVPPSLSLSGESWESYEFEHLPLVGVTTILSGLEAKVRNAESDMIRYLLTMIEKGTFKFTDIDAIVIHNSNYIIKGTNYQAKIFLAAYDKSINPEIWLGPIDSSLNKEDGTYYYKRNEAATYDTTTVTRTGGKGFYNKTCSSVGNFKWSGLIRLPAHAGGLDIWKPFREEYQVVEPMLVVSPTKMNVFYMGVDNPVDISVPGVPADKLHPAIDNGIIKQVGKGSYIVNPSRAGQNANVSVVAEIDKTTKKNMGTKTFRVRIVPDPVAKVNGIKGAGGIERSVLLAQTGVIAEMENFEFDLQFRVTEFTVSTIVGGFTTDKTVKSNRFSGDQMSLIKQTIKGQKVYIENIRAIGPDGTTRQLGSIALMIK
jgi:gliding motility-associated protein GldM